jgi:hypothetical protein
MATILSPRNISGTFNYIINCTNNSFIFFQLGKKFKIKPPNSSSFHIFTSIYFNIEILTPAQKTKQNTHLQFSFLEINLPNLHTHKNKVPICITNFDQAN